MERFILLYKKQGETPLFALERLKIERPDLKDINLTYAGRLDPMAEGLLLVLVGDECKNKEKYLSLDKEYEVEILFGFETDTYDLLGIVENSSCPFDILFPSAHIFSKILKRFIGDIEQDYPPYSSKTVGGKPLFQIAREGKIKDIKIPKHIISIKDIKILEERKISGKDIESYIKEKISLVMGDFRQDEIFRKWQEILSNFQNEEFLIIKVRVASGSGAYMRTLAHDIGKALNTNALAFHIKRLKIGEFII